MPMRHHFHLHPHHHLHDKIVVIRGTIFISIIIISSQWAKAELSFQPSFHLQPPRCGAWKLFWQSLATICKLSFGPIACNWLKVASNFSSQMFFLWQWGDKCNPLQRLMPFSLLPVFLFQFFPKSFSFLSSVFLFSQEFSIFLLVFFSFSQELFCFFRKFFSFPKIFLFFSFPKSFSVF